MVIQWHGAFWVVPSGRGALGAEDADGHVKWPAIARCETVLQCAPCARTHGRSLALPSASAAPKPAARHWLALRTGQRQAHCPSFGARTGHNASRWHANILPLVRAQGAHGKTACAQANGTSNGLQMDCVQTVPQCAPCARTNGMPLALPSASAAPRPAARHWLAAAHGHSKKNFTYPLAGGPQICYPCGVSRRAGLSQGARRPRAAWGMKGKKE